MSTQTNLIKVKPIKNEEDYENTLARIDEIFDAKEGTTEADELDILVTLVERYEGVHYPMLPPEPIEAIKFRMEQLGMTQADLAKIIGANRASEILHRKRKLSIEMIKKLHKELKISVEILLLF
jgi:HTH-type transcriptional regulator/antitoxin HigA